MADTDTSKLVIRDYPVWLWLAGLATCLIGLYMLRSKGGIIPGVIAIGIGLILGLWIAHVVLIDADKNDGSLRIRYLSALHRDSKELLLSDIAAVEVESSSGGEGGNVYRVVFRLRNGQIEPLHSFYSSGFRSKEKRARLLSEFIGVEGPAGPGEMRQISGRALRRPFTLVEEGEIAGVRWQVENGGYGTSPVTRWASPEVCFADGFLLLAQKPEAMKEVPGGGLAKAIGGILYRPLLSLYGFEAENTPGLDEAQMLELDKRLEKTCVAFSSHPEEARRLLDPWVVTMFEQWCNRYPLKTAEDPGEGQNGQLAVLFSPHKLYVALFNSTNTNQAYDLIQFGVDLARQVGAR